MQISSSISSHQIPPRPVVAEEGGSKYIHISGEGAGATTQTGVTDDDYIYFNYYCPKKIKILEAKSSTIPSSTFLTNGSAYDYGFSTGITIDTLPSTVDAGTFFTIKFNVQYDHRFFYIRIKYELV